MARNGHDGDVILLPELLRSVDDCSSGLCGHRFAAFEAEEFALLVAGFYHAVRVERQTAARGQVELVCLVVCVQHNPQWKRTGQLENG